MSDFLALTMGAAVVALVNSLPMIWARVSAKSLSKETEHDAFYL